MPSSALISMVTQSLRLSRHGALVLLLFIFRIHMFLRFGGENSIAYMHFDTLLNPKRHVQIIFVLTACYRGSRNTSQERFIMQPEARSCTRSPGNEDDNMNKDKLCKCA